MSDQENVVMEAATPVKERLQHELGNILEWVKDTGEVAGEFVQEQAPLLVEELLTYGAIVHTKNILIGIALLGLVVFFARRILRFQSDAISNLKTRAKNYDNANKIVDWEIGYWFARVGSIMLGIIITIITLKQVTQLAKVLFTPRLYLMETLSRMF